MTYLIEYLGKFEFIFETILDYESGDQMGSFDAKKPPSKISCLGTFKGVNVFIIIKKPEVNNPVLQSLSIPFLRTHLQM
jgi:hypothetical protein